MVFIELDSESFVFGRIVEPPQTSFLSSLPYTFNLSVRNRPINLLISDLVALFLPHVRIRMILLHDIHKTIRRHLLRQKAHNLRTLVLLARHDQMTNQQPALRNSISRKAQIAHLRMHRLDALFGRLGIIIRFEEPFPRLRPPHLKVRQVDIHQAIHELERLWRIKTRRVVDDGHAQSPILGVQDAQCDLWDDMLWRDDVDVVHVAYFLQLDVPIAQFLGGEIHAVSLVRDVVILTEDAAEVASAHEYRSTAIVALNARFCSSLVWVISGCERKVHTFTEVRRYHIHFCLFTNQTHPRRLIAIDAAQARTEVAVAQVAVGLAALFGGVTAGQSQVAGDVVVEEEWRGEMEMSTVGDAWETAAEGLHFQPMFDCEK